MTPIQVEQHGTLPPAGLPVHDDETLETSQGGDTLWTTPAPLPAREVTRRRWLVRGLVLSSGLGASVAVVGAMVVAGVMLVSQPVVPAPADLELVAWRDWLVVNPEADVDLRMNYVELLAARGRAADAFEEALSVVRQSQDAAALASAIRLALDLARKDDPDGLWAERAAAATDRYARYWPADPVTPLLVEDVVHTLRSVGAHAPADALARAHLRERECSIRSP